MNLDTLIVWLFRIFFLTLVAIDIVFVYAAFFNRELPRHIALWVFGSLLGLPLTIDPTAERVAWSNWLAFSFVSLLPPVVWIVFEFYVAKRLG